MARMPNERQFDLALFGATGFTGGLTAEYLSLNAPAGLRWALVGRNREKLEAVRSRLAETAPAPPLPELLEADAHDLASLTRVAEATRVAVTTIGPYALHGEQLVAACAASGTDYADLTGEPEFVDRMYVAHHAEAERNGARLVHCCGFDSIPHDLGAYFTVKQLPEHEPLRVDGYVRAGGSLSGGTYHSAINGFGRARQTLEAAKQRRRQEPRPVGRTIHSAPPRIRLDDDLGGWVVPLPTIDGTMVRRSAAALDRYGPEFTYGHNMVAKRLGTAAGLATGLSTVFLLAQLPPTRKLLLKAKSSGDGPGKAERAKSWFTVRFVGEGGGERVVTEVSGGDPFYEETAKMLAESALCLAFDDLPQTAGQVTTAAAMGDELLTRLGRAGIPFRLLEPAQT
jgi:short subunit dehydrogenase-like uncharacterized protein